MVSEDGTAALVFAAMASMKNIDTARDGVLDNAGMDAVARVGDAALGVDGIDEVVSIATVRGMDLSGDDLDLSPLRGSANLAHRSIPMGGTALDQSPKSAEILSW